MDNLTLTITRQGVLADSGDYIKDNTFKKTTKIGDRVFEKTIVSYKHSNLGILYARFGVPYKQAAVIQSSIDEPQSRKIKSNIDLYDNQQIVCDHLMQKVFTPEKKKLGIASCILVMDTGLGKTYTAGALIARLGYKTLVVAPNKGILNEWRKMLTNLSLFVGEYHSQKKQDGDVVLITSKSAIKDKFIFSNKNIIKRPDLVYGKVSHNEYFGKFGLVIYDEIQNYATDMYQEIFWRTYCVCNLGITATPDERLDDFDVITRRHCGPLVRANNIPGFCVEAVKWNGKVLAIKYEGSLQHTRAIENNDGWTQVPLMLRQFAEDPHRTQLIIDKALDLLKRFLNVFIFVEHRSFIDELKGKIEAATKLEVGTLLGGVSQDHYAKAIEKSIIIITYSFGKEGISIPKMNAIIFAHPRRNKMRQILGRILRATADADNNSITREIIDIIDQRTSIRSQFADRKKIYEEKGFTIDTCVVKYHSIVLQE
jgi:superfamily II DNA or RNA helicase